MGDECYSHFVYDPHKPCSIASAKRQQSQHHHYWERVETFAMTGWRIGYTLAPEETHPGDDQGASHIHLEPDSIAQSTPPSKQCAARWTPFRRCSPNMPSAGSASWKGCARFRRHLRMARVARLRLPECFRAPGRRQKNAAGEKLHRAFKLLLEKAHVALVAGEAFGAPGFLRLSYATSIERIEEGLRRLEKFFSRAEAAS